MTRPPIVAVLLLSAAAIAYQILLTRLFSVILWHHFATMVISIALLGVGASGTALALARGWLIPRYAAAFAVCAVAFGLTAPGGFALAQRVAFNPLEIIWDGGQQFHLLQVYLLLTVPFFAAALAIGLTLARFRMAIGQVYRADLIGAGLGAAGLVGLLFLLPAGDALRVIGAAGPMCAGLVLWPRTRSGAVTAGLAAVILAMAWPADWLQPQPSPYKDLSIALNVPEARIVAERTGPLGLVTVVESPRIPFRHAPGLSLTATDPIPEQLGLFVDASGMTAITRFDGDLAVLAHLDRQTAALPYHLLKRPTVLVLGTGGGEGVLRALQGGAAAIDAVELNRQVADLLSDDFATFSGDLLRRPEVTPHIAEARSFVEATGQRWDLIQVPMLGSLSTAAGGLGTLSETPLYTVEAVRTYLSRLTPGGQLAMTRWLRFPPRDSIKLLATVTAALAAEGVTDPAARVVMIRSWSTVTLVVSAEPLTEAEIAAARRFAGDRGFDLVWLPGLRREEANRFTVLAQPYLYDAAAAIFGPDRQAFLDDYPFHVAPATDDSPYFSRFFTWSLLPELLTREGTGSLTLLDSGTLVLLLTLAQAALAGAVLILLPLLWLRGGGTAAPAPARWRVATYFAGLGFAFIFVEIAFIQRLTLFLGHPLAAIAVVLAGFLVFAGLGAGVARKLAEARPRSGILLAGATLAVLCLAYLALLPPLMDMASGLSFPAKTMAVLAIIGPLAFAMGLPFPMGLSALSAQAPALVPWAWGINGCTSVIGAVLAGLLGLQIGFTAVVGIAALLYLAAGAVLRPVATDDDSAKSLHPGCQKTGPI